MAVPVIKSVEAAAKIRSLMAYSLFLVFEDPALKCYSAVFTLGKKLSPALVNSPSRVRDRLVMDRECRICAGHFGVSVQCPQRSAVGASPTARPRRGGTFGRRSDRCTGSPVVSGAARGSWGRRITPFYPSGTAN